MVPGDSWVAPGASGVNCLTLPERALTPLPSNSALISWDGESAASVPVFAVAVWTGPGGSRVRMPLARVVNPLSRTWRPWGAAFVVVVVAALALGLLAEQRGVQWTPGQDRPLSGQLVGQ